MSRDSAAVIASVLPVLLLVMTLERHSSFFGGIPTQGMFVKVFGTVQILAIAFGEVAAIVGAGSDEFADDWAWLIWAAFATTFYLVLGEAVIQVWGVKMWQDRGRGNDDSDS